MQPDSIKQRLKDAVIRLLNQKHFERITVTEICREARISRVTFYTWYDDKYELLDNYFKDMLNDANGRFCILQDANNAVNDAVTGYCNLLESIMDIYYEQYDFFKHAEQKEDQNIYSRYYWYVIGNVEQFTVRYCKALKPVFSPEQTSALLCNALWGYIHSCREKNCPVSEIRSGARKALLIMLKSGLFKQRSR
jgi:AcrR family transcriptional regulator